MWTKQTLPYINRIAILQSPSFSLHEILDYCRTVILPGQVKPLASCNNSWGKGGLWGLPVSLF